MVAIKNAKIVTSKKILEGYTLFFNKKILQISKKIPQNIKTIDAKGLYLSSGFIDLHIHGSNGADTMDATQKALNTISKSLLKNGVTSFLATTMTCSNDRIKKALENVKQNRHRVDGAKILGIHLEGPFINPKKSGAQNPKYIQKPNIESIKNYLDIIKVITIAPEIDEAERFIKYIKKSYPEIVFSIGHTKANYKEAIDSFKWGVTHATHLYNAMERTHHREPSAIEAILNTKDISCEIIADNIHINPIYYSLTYKLKRDNLILITDAIRATCLKSGEYELGGQKIFVDNKKATLENGVLAGSILKLNEALKNFYNNVDITIPELIKLVTINPAKVLNQKLGKIAKGYPADIVLFDKDFNIKSLFIEGERKL
jgi:N-acetylglucosamine-6-phosphate deacetylase